MFPSKKKVFWPNFRYGGSGRFAWESLNVHELTWHQMFPSNLKNVKVIRRLESQSTRLMACVSELHSISKLRVWGAGLELTRTLTPRKLAPTLMPLNIIWEETISVLVKKIERKGKIIYECIVSMFPSKKKFFCKISGLEVGASLLGASLNVH